MSTAARRRDPVVSATDKSVLAAFSRVGRVLALSALAATTIPPCLAGECLSRIEGAHTVVARTDQFPDAACALQTYSAQAATLRQRALATGTVSYEDVIETAYPRGIIDRELLETKARWRATLGHGFTFVTDYAALSVAVDVRPLESAPDPNLQSTLVAQYESTSHLIGIAPAASNFALFHEAGHALQRATLQARGAAPGRRADTTAQPAALQLHAGTADDIMVRRLQYLCCQEEFEVRLQDLNRFHALVVTGHPILSPLDTVRALTALGMSLSYEETHDAFAVAGQSLSPAIFAQHRGAAPRDGAMVAVAFEDARELCLMQRLALQIDPSFWPQLLAKMIFEAPGHL